MFCNGISVIQLLLAYALTFDVFLCEDSMEHQLRPPEEGVDMCYPLAELLGEEKNNRSAPVGQVCPASNQFWYYNCCGKYGHICCFQLQPKSWLFLGFFVPAAIGLLALQLLFGLFTHLFKLCCCSCDQRQPQKTDQ